MNDMVYWNTGNGAIIDLWKDNWIQPDLNLEHLRTSPIGEHQIDRISELKNDNGGCNLGYIKNSFPQEIAQKLAIVNPPKADNGEDTCMWR